jgi:cell division protein FtsL
MTEFHTIKAIDNSRLVRPRAPHRVRDMLRQVTLGAVLAGAAMLYAWQHFQCIQLRYQLESLKTDRSQAAELNQELKLEVADLRAPSRIDQIARKQLGLTLPAPGQVEPLQGPSEPVFAELHTAVPIRAR